MEGSLNVRLIFVLNFNEGVYRIPSHTRANCVMSMFMHQAPVSSVSMRSHGQNVRLKCFSFKSSCKHNADAIFLGTIIFSIISSAYGAGLRFFLGDRKPRDILFLILP